MSSPRSSCVASVSYTVMVQLERRMVSMEQANEMQDVQTSGTPPAHKVIDDLSASAWAFAALASALEVGLLEALTEARSIDDLSTRSGISSSLVEGILDVLVALGLLSRVGANYSGAPDLLPLLQKPA